MAPSQDFKDLAAEIIRADRELAISVFDEAMTLSLNGEVIPARLLLRDLVNGTIGFEKLSEKSGIPSKSLHRMLSGRGNPGMNNLGKILEALRQYLSVESHVISVSTNAGSRAKSRSGAA